MAMLRKPIASQALRLGRVSEAEDFLRASGRSPGSPQLNSFGPSMRLAAELLERHSREAVLQYLEDCKVFWQIDVRSGHDKLFAGPERLDEWAEAVRAGMSPDFRPNIGY